jgi:hypothetical protein
MVMLPVIVPPAKGSLVAIELVIVPAKFASSFKAAASSLSVLSVAGLESMRLVIAVVTYCVVANCVLLVAADAVGASGVPVNVGLENIVALDSLVTLPNPTCVDVTLWGLFVELVCVDKDDVEAIPASDKVWFNHLEEEVSYCIISLSPKDVKLTSSISARVFSSVIALLTNAVVAI